MLNTLAARDGQGHAATERSGGYDYNKWCIYFFAELLKLVRAPLRAGSIARSPRARARERAQAVCMVTIVQIKMGDTKEARDQAAAMHVLAVENVRYAVPGFLFFVQNNLRLPRAVTHLSNSAFQLLLGHAHPPAMLGSSCSASSGNAVEWVAVVLCTVGATQYNLSSCTTGELNVSVEGLLIMLRHHLLGGRGQRRASGS